MTDSAQTPETTETFDVNARPALVCVDDADRQRAVISTLEALGYRVSLASSAVDATEQMRKTGFDIVVLDEAFQGSGAHDNTVLAAVQWMPTVMRRYMFVVLLGAQVKTFDNMVAFARSVNLVVNYNELAQFQAILQRAIPENDQFYRVFRQVLQEAGKR